MEFEAFLHKSATFDNFNYETTTEIYATGLREYEIIIECRDRDGYINATSLCNYFDKSFIEISKMPEWRILCKKFRDTTNSLKFPPDINLHLKSLVYDHKGTSTRDNFIKFVHPFLIKFVAQQCSKLLGLLIGHFLHMRNELIRCDSTFVQTSILKKRLRNTKIKQTFVDLLFKKILLDQRLTIVKKVPSKTSPEYIAEENENIKLESMLLDRNVIQTNPKRICIVQTVFEINEMVYIKFVDIPFDEKVQESFSFKYSSSRKNYKILFEIILKNIDGTIVTNPMCLSIPSDKINKLLLLTKEFVLN
jgi:hypothetical protein